MWIMQNVDLHIAKAAEFTANDAERARMSADCRSLLTELRFSLSTFRFYKQLVTTGLASLKRRRRDLFVGMALQVG